MPPSGGQRTIAKARAEGGGDDGAARVSNALAVIRGVTSAAAEGLGERGRAPRAAELLDAVDGFLVWDEGQSRVAIERARQLRARVVDWSEARTTAAPGEVVEAARAFIEAMEGGAPGEATTGGRDGREDASRRMDSDAMNERERRWQDNGALVGNPGPEEPLPSERPASPSVEESAAVMQRAASAAAAISLFMNLVGMLAAPRVWARASAWTSREHLLEHIDDYLAAIELSGWRNSQGQPAFESTKSSAQRLRALCATWEPGPEVPADISGAARDVLGAFGLPEPAEGWDRYEGPLGGSPMG